MKPPLNAGVIGWPIAHSLSPRLHGYWLARHGVPGYYVPLAVHPDHLATVLRVLPKMSYRGVNITVPHKEAAMAVMDTVSEDAKRVGAVNTVLVEDGSLHGDNTDLFGFAQSVLEAVPGWSAADRPIAVIGAGGAASAVIVACLDFGASEIRLVNRTRQRAEEVAARFGDRVRPVDWDERSMCLEGVAMLVNATTLGMTGQPPLDIRLDDLPISAVVADIVYAPLQSPLLARASGRGNRTVDGLGMLLHQARPGFTAWFGVEPRVTADLRAHVIAGMA